MNKPYILIVALAPIPATAAVPEPVQPPGTTPQERIDAAREWIHKEHPHLLLNQQYVVSDDVRRYEDADFIICPTLADLLRLRVISNFDGKNVIDLETGLDSRSWRHGESMGCTTQRMLNLFMPILNLALGNDSPALFENPDLATGLREINDGFKPKFEQERKDNIVIREELARVREELAVAQGRLQALATSVPDSNPETETPDPEWERALRLEQDELDRLEEINQGVGMGREAPGPPPPPPPPPPAPEAPRNVVAVLADFPVIKAGTKKPAATKPAPVAAKAAPSP